MRSAQLLAASLLAVALAHPAAASPATYPQLIATRYPTGVQAPVAAGKPDFSFVDTSRIPAGASILSAAKAASGATWVVTDRGAFQSVGEGFAPLSIPATSPATHLPVPSDTRVAAVASDPLGHIWAATNHGLFITDGGAWWSSIDRQDGMPYENLNCIHLAGNGDVWCGTSEGAWRLRDGKFRYFWGKRWLPGNVVSAIWSDDSGKTWLQTDGGLSCIEERPMTLAEKAAYYDKITQERHNRRGYIGHISLVVPGDPTKGHKYGTADSEGIWTGWYVSAMSFRYAATHDPKARAEARKSMYAMLDMERLSGIPGYPARALITEDEIKAGVQGWDPRSPIHGEGKNGRSWVRSPVDPKVWCKTDTSSDTMDGHFFAWFNFFEHAADKADKARVAAVVRRAADHIITHNFTLIGHTGFKTRWGIWGPEYLNQDPDWFGERGINSLALLSHLKVAYHVTGDMKYQHIYDRLITKYHYLQNGLLNRRGINAPWWNINHSDDQLAYMEYYPLLILEKDPARRRILTESVARTWEPTSSTDELPLALEHSSFYNFAYGAMTGNPCEPDDGIQDLQDWPWDMVDWTVKNSQRTDVRIWSHKEDGEPRSTVQLDRVLPSSEQPLRRWNGDPWHPDGGVDGREEHDGVSWLLAYWMGVYHGYVSKDQ